MKKVIFHEQGMQNFCNHIDPLILPIENNKLLMVTGPNGSGKTSMFQALPFTLYGVCEKGRADDVLNNKVEKNCHTWTTFTVIDGDEINNYRVDRYVKFTRKGSTVHLFKNDDEKPYKVGQKEVLPEIEKIIMPYKLLTNTLLFGQKVKTFFTDLKDSEQKEIFRKILTLEDFIVFHKQTGIKYKEIVELLSETATQIEVTTSLIQETKNTIQDLEDQQYAWASDKSKKILRLNIVIENTNKELQDKIVVLQKCPVKDDALELITQKLILTRQELNNLESISLSKINEITAQGEAKKSQLEQEASQAESDEKEKLATEREEMYQRMNKSTVVIDDELKLINERRSELAAKLSTVKTSLKFVGKESDTLKMDLDMTECPTCHQKIPAETINDLKEKLDGYEIILNEYSDETKEIMVELQTLEDREVALNLQLNKINKDISDEDIERVKLYDEKVATFKERLTGAKLKLAAMIQKVVKGIEDQIIEDKDELENKVLILSSDQIKLQNEIRERNELSNDIRAKENLIKNLEDQLVTVEESDYDSEMLDNLQEEKLPELNAKLELLEKQNVLWNKQEEVLNFWKVGFSSAGIQSMLIDDSIPFMNSKISEYMDKLSNGRYSVTFDTLAATKAGEFRDKISVQVFDNHTHANKRVNISGGQERLVDIGTILTLNDLQSVVQDVEINILLFDEIFDALDDNNVGAVSNLIRQVAKDKWIGVISHRHIDQVDADDVLSFGG